jgi:hypothetical protein
MKVILGKYPNWFGPYQLADKLIWWQNNGDPDCKWAQRADKLGEYISETWLGKLLNWANSKNTRQEYVKIDKWDTHSMDHTLALIILPLLKQLKATKHGAPKVDDFDCPQHLWSTNAKPVEEYELDENWFKRWDYVLQEMIWAFEQHTDPNEDQKFYDHSNVDPKLPFQEQLQQIHCDHDKMNHHYHRKQQAFKLFGKYFQNLWD